MTATISGSGFANVPSVRLSHFPDFITATGVSVAADGTSLTATFDLSGAVAAAWDVLVTNPDAQIGGLLSGFVVTSVQAPQLRVSVVGPSLQTGNLVVRRDRRTPYDVVIENFGNVDALDVPLWLAGIPTDATVELDFALSYPPQAGGEPNWSTVPLFFTSPGGKYVPLVIPRVPPGRTTRRVFITVPGPTHAPFTLSAAVTPPWVDGNVFRGCVAAGGITNPACMGGQLTAINAFLASNPSILALSGPALWAKVAWNCEGAGTLPAALVKAEQVLDYLEGPVEGSAAPAGCEAALGTWWREVLTVSVVTSVDPNDKLGVQGTLTGTQAFPYSIRFENLSNATAPAQQVIVSDQIDAAKLDVTTLTLDAITFGNVHVYPPPGVRSYSTRVDLRPAKNLLVDVAVSLDPFTNVLTWYFTSIDPATGVMPQSALVGFLPPNMTPPEGEGSVLFTVRPKAGLTNGTVISNGASILFDDPPAITTPNWSNAVDNTPPGSHVLPLSASYNQPSIPVSWMADGSPPDLRDYTIYVKEDAGAYRVWRQNTTATTDTLGPGQNHQFHTYAFYSVARDQVGNIDAPPPGAPPAPDATTQSTTGVGDPAADGLSLLGAWPNPASGPVSVQLALPGRGAATLELLDVAGRRVFKRDVGSLGPGRHVVTLDPAKRLGPGLYFLRLTRGGEVLNARVALVR